MASVEKRVRGGRWTGRWRVRWREKRGGRSVECSREFDSRKEANVFRAKVEVEVAATGRFTGRAVTGATLTELLEKYLLSVQGTVTSKTFEHRIYVLDGFVDWVLGSAHHEDVSALNAENLEEYFKYLGTIVGRNGKPLQHNSKAKYIQIISHAWDWLYRRGEASPVAPTPYAKRKRRAAPSFPCYRDVDEFIEEWSNRYEGNRRAAIIMRFTGLRPTEVCHLDWDHFFLDERMLHIPANHPGTKTDGGALGRKIPISDHLANEMSGWGLRVGRVMGVEQSRLYPIKWKNVWDRVIARKKSRLDAKELRDAIAGQPVYCFRGLFQTFLMQQDVQSDIVKMLVGHDLGVRRHYLSPDPKCILCGYAGHKPSDTHCIGCGTQIRSAITNMKEAVNLIPPLVSPQRPKLNSNPSTIQIYPTDTRFDYAPERNRTSSGKGDPTKE